MKQMILAIVGAGAVALPGLNAQQPSPGRTVVPQPTPKFATARARFSPGVAVNATATPRAGNKPINRDHSAQNNNNTNSSTTNQTNKRNDYREAQRRYRHERHDRDWWRRYYITIVFVGGGYYYWDSGYWCPAWGYDPNYENYAYDGPIYTYGNLLPDQVVINVQHALKELGYYAGNVTGSLGPDTQKALGAYQADYGLDVTGAVDEATVRALGLI